jgi:hypothetical protein
MSNTEQTFLLSFNLPEIAMTQKLYHGCTAVDAKEIMANINVTNRGFHMSPDINISKEYGSTIICFEVGSFDCHVGTIDKSGNAEEDMKSGIEYVIRTHAHLVSFYNNLDDVYVV